jgi:succinate dehydrogenase hydrophobic anchor subunit
VVVEMVLHGVAAMVVSAEELSRDAVDRSVLAAVVVAMVLHGVAAMVVAAEECT